VGAPVDENIPEYWRANTPDDMKLERVLSSPGLSARLERETRLSVGDVMQNTPQGDTNKAVWIAKMMADFKPDFVTVHLSAIDEQQHTYGPGSAEAHAAIENADAALGVMEAAARAAHPDEVGGAGLRPWLCPPSATKSISPTLLSKPDWSPWTTSTASQAGTRCPGSRGARRPSCWRARMTRH
jgi:hypothetical protein